MNTTRRIACLAAALACTFGAAAQTDADFPNRPIRIIVPFAPGASNDAIARLVASNISTLLKQPVVVENRTGAGGDIGMAFVAKSKPDGYTVLMTSNAATVSTATKRKPAIDMLNDLQPVGLVGTQPMLLVASPNIGVSSLAQFFAAAKAAPEKYSYGTPGIGSPHHMAFELISVTQGLKMIHVPFAGSSQSLTELMGGRVSVALASTQSAGPLVAEGRLKLLAIAAKTRSREYPGVPTVAESGVGDLEAGFWYGFTLPAGTPPAIEAKLANALATTLAMPAVRDQIRKMDVDINNLQGEAFSAFMANDYRKWKSVAQKAGIVIE